MSWQSRLLVKAAEAVDGQQFQAVKANVSCCQHWLELTNIAQQAVALHIED